MVDEVVLPTITNQKSPSECTNIEEVRSEIDAIDKSIINLLSLRFDFVKEVVKYKDGNPNSIEAPARRKAVIESRSHWAEQKGLDPKVIGEIYDRLVDYFICEEKKIKNF